VNGVHDMGGLEGFGPVEVEADEPYFHEPWERQQLGISFVGFSLLRNGGHFRHAIERMDPVHYLASSYYEHWATGLATALVEDGHLTAEELEQRAPGFPLSRPVAPVHPEPGPDSDQPRFQPVDVVASVPDIEAHGSERQRVPTYSVRFEAAELWGSPPEPGLPAAVHVDLWETYLEPDPVGAPA
jgi:nitrile hydratase subunit beta